jgi:hypothetical protein
MRSMLLPTLRAACLLAAVSTVGLWVRSHRVSDQYTWPVRGGGGAELIDSRTLQTTPGRLVFQERTVLM